MLMKLIPNETTIYSNVVGHGKAKLTWHVVDEHQSVADQTDKCVGPVLNFNNILEAYFFNYQLPKNNSSIPKKVGFHFLALH